MSLVNSYAVRTSFKDDTHVEVDLAVFWRQGKRFLMVGEAYQQLEAELVCLYLTDL